MASEKPCKIQKVDDHTNGVIESAYQLAKQRYQQWGIDTDEVIRKALEVPIALHCWQADDLRGFENAGDISSGGIMATGNYPGVPRTPEEMRQDLAKVISLIPGKQRINLHACYGENLEKGVDRDTIEPKHFKKWIEWAKAHNVLLDFNSTYFAHPKAKDGFTLSHQDEAIRKFWIDHGIACRKIAQQIATEQNAPCLLDWWIPDGSKDIRVDRDGPRKRVIDSYDQIFDKKHGIDTTKCVDFVESKLFGLGCEEYTVGSAEFYTGYAITRQMGLCMDMGHYHPTETIHDKIVSLLNFLPRILLHVSRPIRWDSDHVVIFNDDVKDVFLTINRCNAWGRVFVALDYFDASINRIGAYVIGTRATRKAILYAMLEPTHLLKQYEAQGKNTHRLALLEEMKSAPFGPVWDQLCAVAKVKIGDQWLKDLDAYEQDVMSKRSK